jgi:crotonobetainyl-CoA:carnitine CoA-transferase CaiB-like acyl-CoA transferase
MHSSLAGVTIIDLSRLIPGAGVTHYFADLGATVIKVEEPPVGDYLRDVMPQIDGLSLQEMTLDRNKQSILLSLRTAEGQAVLHHLVSRADAVVAVSPPDAMSARGADYATLSGLNPRLVYLSFTGLGAFTRYRSLPSHGGNLAGFAGVHGVATRDDDVMVPDALPYGRYRIPMEQAALRGAFMLLAGIHERDRTGIGRFVDLSIAQVLMAGDYAAMTDWVNNRDAYMVDLEQPTPRYGVYRAGDDKVLIVCPIEKRFWLAFCEVMERSDLADRGDWSASTMDFSPGDVELYGEVAAVIRTRPRDEWIDRLIEARVPCSPAYDIDEVVSDPAIGAPLWVETEHPVTGRLIRLMAPPGVDHTMFHPSPAPGLGRDTDAVLEAFAVPEGVVRAARDAGSLPTSP